MAAIELDGFQVTEVYLQNVGERSSQSVRDALRDGAYAIKASIEEFTPYKYGALESSWIVAKSKGDGINQRDTYTIELKDQLTWDPHAKTSVYVSDYIFKVHDMSWDRRGPGTRDKGSEAGPKFIDRAVQENEAAIDYEVERAIDRAINRI